ncbi:hypothetical protein IE53DRAFT_404419 [Violaceomyces palustris]|uniref:Uncharacterized protein n=1 Tax=Violaceomyces palustris TaxID=1673888 RepID=A0ACD0P6V6_9BASI|nr:hypothetical protein IE53DRAFT_404419 [Violaceomyces palustris]
MAYQAPSLAIVPTWKAAQTSTSVLTTSHKEHTGVHDAIRYGQRNLQHETSNANQHPIQNRLELWDETRDNLKLTMHRNVFGLGAPVRTLMERKLVSHNPNFPARQSSNIHLDILNGDDELIEPVDFLPYLQRE